MLSLFVIQVLATVTLVAVFVGFLFGGRKDRALGRSAPVVAQRNPGRWAEATWVVGSVVSVLWPVGVLLVPSDTYHWPATPEIPASSGVQLFGFAVLVGGGLLFFASRWALGRFLTPAIQVREGHELVQSGPYRYVRHPVYTAIVAQAVGSTLLYLSPILAGVAVCLLGLAVYRARLEEELLASPEAFGTRYTEYVARTGRFLPRIRTPR